jgi:hypothetical protein
VSTRDEELRVELESARVDFHRALSALSRDGWRARSRNAGWTNGELCFHMLLGFILVSPLYWIMRAMHYLPDWCDVGFARLLDASTPLFNRINALGPRIGARVLSARGVGRQFDRAMNRVTRRLERLTPKDRALGMHYPTRWDPRFTPVMTVEQLLRYPIGHLRHHLAQLSIDSNRSAAGADGERGAV